MVILYQILVFIMKTLFKKLFITLAVLGASFATISALSPASVYADGVDFKGECRDGFLGLQSWDCGVEITNQDTLKSGIWIIVSNVLIDITVLASYLVIGYTIYGGYLYVFSAGEPGKAATGKKALAQAFIGLAIVMLASVIMNSIRIALLGANGSFAENCTEAGKCIDPSALVSNAIQWTVGIVGAVSLIFIVYGGISYTTSYGDQGKLQKARKMITYALIGLVIVALAEIITAFVSNMIRSAKPTSYINATISKEVHEKTI